MKVLLCFALLCAVVVLAKPTEDTQNGLKKKLDEHSPPLSLKIENESASDHALRVERSEQKLTSVKSTIDGETPKTMSNGLNTNLLENEKSRHSILTSFGPKPQVYPSASIISSSYSAPSIPYVQSLVSYPSSAIVSNGAVSSNGLLHTTYGLGSPLASGPIIASGSSYGSSFPAPVIPTTLANHVPHHGGLNIAQQIIHKPVITELQEVIHKPVITEVEEIINKPVVQEVQQVIHKPLYTEHIGLSPSYHGYQQHIHKHPVYQQSVQPTVHHPIAHGNTIHLADQYEHAVTTTTTTEYCAPGTLGWTSNSGYNLGLDYGSGFVSGYGAGIPYAPISGALSNVASYSLPAAASVGYTQFSPLSYGYSTPASVGYSTSAPASIGYTHVSPLSYSYSSPASISYAAPASVAYTSLPAITSPSYAVSSVNYLKPTSTCRTGNEEGCKNIEEKSSEDNVKGKSDDEITFDTIQPYQQQPNESQLLNRNSEDTKIDLDALSKNIQNNEGMMKKFRKLLAENNMSDSQTDKKQDKQIQMVAPSVSD
ncbi:uncharacterized protein LOC126908338 [Daktulosphaira vitifoliae]|uniref:uncharacterized protein LOC126908338 n=1 Tax=Daktulosphaira vitifoliae TaxID=58002 RepID=UPI0021AA5F59|nr:uncharacterized protein LOC126908338 [Daktulosphaira vitifoliae]